MMYKRVLFSIIISVIMITGCSSSSKDNEVNANTYEVINSMNAIIDGKEYIINLEDNKTVKSFINMLPLEFDMEELNGNEKYVYLDNALPMDSYSPKRINAGDIMLYGDNCLVLFYKSFDTSYSYTKIGHIDNLPDLGNGNIKIKFK